MTTPDQRLLKRMKQARTEAALSQRELAARIGVVRETLANFETGRKTVSIQNLRAIAGATGHSLAWFFEDEDVPQETPEQAAVRHAVRQEIHELKRNIESLAHSSLQGFTRVRLLGEVRGGHPRGAIESDDGTVLVPLRWVGRGEDAFALRVTGDSMTPTICPGDIVVVRRQSDAESGQVVVVRFDDATADSEATIKRFVRSPRGAFLEADNRKYARTPCGEAATIIGVVRGLLRDL